MTYRLVCFPFAGAGASAYRQGWKSDGLLEISPVHLPHREDRLSEPPYADLTAAVDDLVHQVERMAPSDGYVLFGHSMGALLAIETAVALERRGGPAPVLVVVSGSSPPSHRTTDCPSSVDDERFVEDVEGRTGYRSPAMRVPELRSILVPTLRADMEFLSRIEKRATEPISSPLLALRGSADAGVPRHEWRHWDACTVAETTFIEFEGGHMFLLDKWGEVRDALENALGRGTR